MGDLDQLERVDEHHIPTAVPAERLPAERISFLRRSGDPSGASVADEQHWGCVLSGDRCKRRRHFRRTVAGTWSVWNSDWLSKQRRLTWRTRPCTSERTRAAFRYAASELLSRTPVF